MYVYVKERFLSFRISLFLYPKCWPQTKNKQHWPKLKKLW